MRMTYKKAVRTLLSDSVFWPEFSMTSSLSMAYNKTIFLALVLIVSVSIRDVTALPMETVRPSKRFSMNYYDLVNPTNPKSWQNTMPNRQARSGPFADDPLERKRFTMNFLDTIDNDDPRSWQNTMNGGHRMETASLVENVRGHHDQRRFEELQKKRSHRTGDDLLLPRQTPSYRPNTLDTIDQLLDIVVRTQAVDEICKSPAMRKLLKIREAMVNIANRYSPDQGVKSIDLC